MENELINLLPQVQGQYRFNYAISPTTWFRVGGPCDILFKPHDFADLSHFLKNFPSELNVTVVGLASNLLIRDNGIAGVTIKLGKAFNAIEFQEGYVDVGAATLDRNLALMTAEHGYKGFEFMSGIPGSIGGALRMNAGCYGSEIKDILDIAYALDETGRLHRLTCEDMGFSYRHCSIPEKWIFIGARFKTKFGNVSLIKENMIQLLKQRDQTQPVHSRTGGSTFANPPGHKAWQLIDQAGCRGYRVNDAQMSMLHCNFMINNGQATAHDLESVGEHVRTKVKETSGIDLKWEIKRIGRH